MEVAAFPEVLTMGGDCRLTLNAKGLNKYHCMPAPMERALFRGSCTCNIPTAEAFQAAEATYAAIKNEEVPPPSRNRSTQNLWSAAPGPAAAEPPPRPHPTPRILAIRTLLDPSPARTSPEHLTIRPLPRLPARDFPPFRHPPST